jgi:AbrB family looped-hinge helix DNA binding protein
MEPVKLSQKGQLVLPKSVRTELKIQPGTFIDIRIENDTIVLRPLKKGPLDNLYGKFENETIIDELEQEHESEIKSEFRA